MPEPFACRTTLNRWLLLLLLSLLVSLISLKGPLPRSDVATILRPISIPSCSVSSSEIGTILGQFPVSSWTPSAANLVLSDLAPSNSPLKFPALALEVARNSAPVAP
jgi:hypothetical protein